VALAVLAVQVRNMLNARQLDILNKINQHGRPMSVSQIAARLNIDPVVVKGRVEDLCRQKFLAQANKTEYWLTESGAIAIGSPDDEELTDQQMDADLDEAFLEAAELPQKQVQPEPIPDWMCSEKGIQAEAVANLGAFGDDDERTKILSAIQSMAKKMQPVKIDRLHLKIETLGLLSGCISDPVITAILGSIVDDLTKISEK